MFDVNVFVGNPTLIELESLKKSDIIEICKHYELECKVSMVKSTLINIVHWLTSRLGVKNLRIILKMLAKNN